MAAELNIQSPKLVRPAQCDQTDPPSRHFRKISNRRALCSRQMRSSSRPPRNPITFSSPARFSTGVLVSSSAVQSGATVRPSHAGRRAVQQIIYSGRSQASERRGSPTIALSLSSPTTIPIARRYRQTKLEYAACDGPGSASLGSRGVSFPVCEAYRLEGAAHSHSIFPPKAALHR